MVGAGSLPELHLQPAQAGAALLSVLSGLYLSETGAVLLAVRRLPVRLAAGLLCAALSLLLAAPERMGQLRPLSYARQVVVTTLQHVAMWLSLGTFILFV